MGKFESYYEYEQVLAQGILIPFLEREGIVLNGQRVLDVGCGAGGFLNVLAARFQIEGLGIDYDPEILTQCRPAAGVTLQAADFLAADLPGPFDFILLRDVLEHCVSPQDMLARAASLLSPDGHVYVTYSPYLSPFGGHQQNTGGFFSRVPYIHILPESLFLRLVQVRSGFYKTASYLREDLKRIRRTWLTTGRVNKCCRQIGLRISYHCIFVVRPDHHYMFGLPTLRMPSLFPLTSLLDPFCTSVELLLVKNT